MYRAFARILRGDIACLVAGVGVLAFVVTTHAEKLVHVSNPADLPEAMEAAAGIDRTAMPTGDQDGNTSIRAIPRPHDSGGGSSSGGIAGGDPATSQSSGFEIGEGFAVGFIGGQAGWGAFVASAVEAHVDNLNPATGDQHLRIGRDDSIAANATVGAFSPNMGLFEDVAATVSVDVFVTGTGRDYTVEPQAPTQGVTTARVRFRRIANIIDVLDDINGDGTFAFEDTGTTWIPDQYVNLTIDVNPVAGTTTISYNGAQIYSIVATADLGTAVQEVVFTGINGGATGGHADFDNYDVAGGTVPSGACCNSDGMSGCEILTADACATAGGTYLGNDTACIDCPMGACCNTDGMNLCVVMTPEECATLSPPGFYDGDGTICPDDCPIVPAVCGTGGDCLSAHDPTPGCDDIECCALVCESLAFCCLPGTGWTQACADAALDTFCTPDAACGVPGTGSCESGGANTTPFCDDTCAGGVDCPGCCDTVCAVDPFCCGLVPGGFWDALCDGEAADLCGCEPGSAPTNDDCVDAIEVFVGPAIVVDNTCGTSSPPDHATCNDGFVVGLGIDIWFQHNATFDGALTVTPTPDDDDEWNTQLAVYEGCDCGALTDPPLVCAPIDDIATVLVTNGTCYLIRLGGTFDGAVGPGTLQLAAVPQACQTAVNDCLESSGTGGCVDLSCCAVICLADPDCCDVAWDQDCADAAVTDCAPLPCPALDVGGANVTENETCGLDTNGGCNSDPAVFTEIVSGDVIHGTAWAELASRDTDWHRLTIDPADDVNLDGLVDVHYSTVSELPIVTFAIRDLDPTCGPGGTDPDLVATTGYSQTCVCITPGVSTVNIADAIYVFAGPGDPTGAGVFEGHPCGAGPAVFGNNYLLSVDVTDNGAPSPQECGAAPCPWDCEPAPDGNVGINDFLEVLAQWTQVGTSCDVGGDPNGVGINAFLAILANWGACP